MSRVQSYNFFPSDFGNIFLSLFLTNGSTVNEGKGLPLCIGLAGASLELEMYPLVGFGGSSNTGNKLELQQL